MFSETHYGPPLPPPQNTYLCLVAGFLLQFHVNLHLGIFTRHRDIFDLKSLPPIPVLNTVLFKWYEFFSHFSLRRTSLRPLEMATSAINGRY